MTEKSETVVTTPAVAIAIFNDKNEVLLQRSPAEAKIASAYHLPSVVLADGEEPVVAAIRALREASGIEGLEEFSFPLPRLWVVDDDISGEITTTSYQVFVCFSYLGEAKPELAGEWLSLEGIDQLAILPDMLAMIISAFDLFCYCWTLAAEEAGLSVPPGGSELLAQALARDLETDPNQETELN